MELPIEVLIHNGLLGVKGARGTLLAVSPHGFYEANMRFGDRVHRVLLPIEGTVLIAQQSEEMGAEPIEVER